MSGEGSSTDNLYGPLPSSIRNEVFSEPPPIDEATKRFTPCFVKSTVASTSDKEKLYSTHIENKSLLLEGKKESMEDAEKRKMQKIRKKHRQKKFLTSKEIKQLKLHELPIACHRYDLFLPLHQLWLQYMDDLWDKSSAEAFTQKLLKADLHGCRLTVCRTKCPSLLGISGIVVQETENCFKIITKEDSMKMVPKSNNVFTFPLRQSVFTIYGNQFKYRGSERAVRKFKAKSTIDM